MKRHAHKELENWWSRNQEGGWRKPLVIRGARQVGKSFLVRDFCQQKGLPCLEVNFDKDPSLAKLFLPGNNKNTVSLLESYFNSSLKNGLLFLDEIQSAPEVLGRLRYFYEDTPEIPVIAAGSLLEFALADFQSSMPVGRIEFFHLGPMRFSEFLWALGEDSLLPFLNPSEDHLEIPIFFHEKLLSLARDFSFVGGMPEAIAKFASNRNFLAASTTHHSILETYQNDFNKYRKRIPEDRMEKVFLAIPSQIGKKWVHARISSLDRAKAIDASLEALSKAKVIHKVHHSSGNGVPLGAEQKDNLFKVLFLDVGLLGSQLGLRAIDYVQEQNILRINEGIIAEQWIGQHLLDLRPSSQIPKIFYWVREKANAMAEVDYLLAIGPKVIPIEVKSGHIAQAKSLQVFMKEKNSPLGILFSINPPHYYPERNIINLPIYMVESLPEIVDKFFLKSLKILC